MVTKIQKWGNSLGLRIPKSCAVETGLESGTAVEVAVHEGKLVVSPVQQKTYRLDELVKAINANNVHGEIDTGHPQGSEDW